MTTHLLWGSNFYRLNWTLGFTCKALYAFFLSSWKSLFLRFWMPRSVSPLVKLNWANLYAYSMSFANVPIHSYIGSSDAQFRRRINSSPNRDTFLFSSFLSVFLEIRIYWQKISPIPYNYNYSLILEFSKFSKAFSLMLLLFLFALSL